MSIQAYSANEPKGKFETFEYDPGELAPDEVEIDVAYCGICHSDLSMLNNDWGMTTYPFVPGHEVSGTVAAKGDAVTHIAVGQKIGLGWLARSCGTCAHCLSGDHNLCPTAEATIVGRHGGFASKVRASALWAIPIPDAISPADAGPLFCGGITVFNPILRNGVSPTDRVAVIGVGGLGHIAIQFLNKWGCHVTAISTSPGKADEAAALGAHQFINAREEGALEKAANSFDLIIDTANANLPWDAYVNALRPGGKFHIVGAAPEIKATVFPLLAGEKSFGGSPLGSPGSTGRMLDFAARHGVAPKTEIFPMSEINAAFEKLEKDQPAHRIVLQNDFK